MLLRLAYLTATTTFTLLRLLPMSDRDQDIEILALRHQLLVLQRQVGKPALTDTDRVVLGGRRHRPYGRLGIMRAKSETELTEEEVNDLLDGDEWDAEWDADDEYGWVR